MNKSRTAQRPVRTCIVCRRHIGKALMSRYVWDPEKEDAVLDKLQIMPGRGAYCCYDEKCGKRLRDRKRGWKRFFRLD